MSSSVQEASSNLRAQVDAPPPAMRYDWAENLDVRFPPLPRTAADVLALLQDPSPEPDIHRLAELVQSDPLVGMLVLKRVNGAYYGLRRRVDNIPKAVHLLGFAEVANLVLTASMMHLRDQLTAEEQTTIFESLMRRSIGAAHFSRAIAGHLSLPQQHLAFAAGLLHAIGRLILLQNKPADYEALWWTCDGTAAPEADAERIIFGIDHTDLSALALATWHLPHALVETVGNYLRPGQIKEMPLRHIAMVVGLAVRATEQCCLEDSADPGGFDPGMPFYILLRSVCPGDTAAPDQLQSFIETMSPSVCGRIEAMMQA